MDIKNLDDFYNWINEQDYEDREYHIIKDLIKIRDSFKETLEISLVSGKNQ